MASFHWKIKSGKKGSASRHSRYIAREGQFNKEDLAASGHGNLPDWASDSPKAFWREADRNERRNGAVYREIEIALPNELTLEQNTELVQQYVTEIAGPKAYQFAVHSPAAAIGDCPQPHAHIMLSDRMPDMITRSPEQYFRRYNAARPEVGGCKKDSGGKPRSVLGSEVAARRAHWADKQNEFLAKHGHAVRVDHRSLSAQGVDATPERHLGQAAVKFMGDEARAALRQHRDSRRS